VIAFLKRIQNNFLRLVNPGAVEEEKLSPVFFEKLQLTCLSGDRRINLRIPGPSIGDVSLQIDNTRRCRYGSVATLTLYLQNGSESLELLDFKLQMHPALSAECKMMVNGFQSWSRSEEMGVADRIVPLFKPARRLLAPLGDANIYRYSGKRGRLHSWSYTYFRYPDDQTLFIGSLNEKSGYTLFEYDYDRDRLIIRKDCSGAAASSGYQLLNLYIGWGYPDQLFKEFMSLSGQTRKIAPKASGWCSWYNYYTTVSETVVRENLAALTQSKLPLDYFQIDDGWQKSIGDWLESNEKFPAGMKSICEAIKSCHYRPGLWLAPLICVPSSAIYREKPEWLLRDRKGKPVKAGYNPGWEGYFYALDFYAPGVKDYLSQIFKVVQAEWGYSMLKLDFLYAAALVPHNGKSRGQIMSEVVDFIDQETRDSIVLGCGVPLGPAFGRVDYCRIGSDVGPYWEDYLKLFSYPERVSTENSLACTIGRRQLDRFAFRSDPDVFILRDGVPGINQNRLNANQRYTLFFLNNLLGGLLFFSDDLLGLTANQLQLLRSSFPQQEVEISGLDSYNNLYHFEFNTAGKSYLAYANLSSSVRTVRLPGSHFFNPDHFILQPGETFALEPYQSVCFYRIEPLPGSLYLIGASGHIFPGSQINLLEMDGECVTLILHPDSSSETTVYLSLPEEKQGLTVNNQYYDAENTGNLNLVRIN
jgi:alpha-galactosidase